MTVSASVLNQNLSWLHCNECYRPFEHHNRLSEEVDGTLKLIQVDLVFAFTSCGHFFCDNCVQAHTVADKFVCVFCHSEASVFRIDKQVPKALEMYLKPPISHLEDSISFQLSNANGLIKCLRTKVGQQKDLLAKAKQELASHKILKEKVNELKQENEKLKKRLDEITRVAGVDHSRLSSREGTNLLASPRIHVEGRLSLKSPVTTASYKPFPINASQMTSNQLGHHRYPPPQSPTVSEIYLPPNQDRRNSYPNYAESIDNESRRYDRHFSGPPPPSQLVHSVYQTPDSRSESRQRSYVSREGSLLPPSPRPVYRTHTTRK